ncbi:YbjN domain-containing protein [Hyphomicrobium sp. 2TAF46]|uniref:YbjN domain-containing protein n=1 Tax=Hyphomicrobium sp. 2TAF46 TaxID=3233019 RepID=UPI003F93ED08
MSDMASEIDAAGVPGQSLVAANDVTSLLLGVTSDDVKDTLQAAGYRVEVLTADGMAVLRSATAGLPFDIRLGNQLPGPEGRHLDMTFVALFAVRGVFPEKLLNDWNRTRRFARLFLDRATPDQEFLVLGMDVGIAGGVSTQYLRAQMEIWDALVNQLIAWLRTALPTAVEPAANDGAGPAPEDIASAKH